MTTANPFAPQAAAQPAASTNPFAAQPPVPPPVQAPPAATPGVQAIARALYFTPSPNPFAMPLTPAQPTAAFPAPVVQVQTSPIPAVAQATAYPPLNPPGERVTALGDAGAPAAPAPAAGAPVEPPTPPAPVELASRRRTRKGATNAGGMPGVVAEAPTASRDLEGFTTEQIVDILIARGYTVALTRTGA